MFTHDFERLNVGILAQFGNANLHSNLGYKVLPSANDSTTSDTPVIPSATLKSHRSVRSSFRDSVALSFPSSIVSWYW